MKENPTILYHTLHRINKNIIVITLFLALILTIVTLMGKDVATAQDTEMSMRSLLLRMNQMRHDDSGFVFIVGFVNPLIKDEDAWTIGDPKDQYSRTIDEVGDNYVCFREHSEGVDLVRCTPFYNILDVTFVQT